MKVIIIDDEEDAIDILESIINLNKEEYSIVGKTTDPVKGLGLIKKHNPDVVFLDIEMPEMNGFELLESLSEINFEIIFATAYDEYAIRAIKENALDYILKPVTFSEVMKALGKAKKKRTISQVNQPDYKLLLNNLHSNYFERIRISTSSGFEFMYTDELIFLKAEGSYTDVYSKNSDKLLISKPIKQIEQELNPNIFFRVHRSYIINIRFIKRFDRTKNIIIMINGAEIPLSRRRYDEFITFLKKTS